MKKIVLSVFDGISALQLALKRAGFKIDRYYASEIDKNPISITQKNFPKTIQLGNVMDIKKEDLPQIWILGGGSPCTDFSGMGKKKGMLTNRGRKIKSLNLYLKLKQNNPNCFYGSSYLFWEFVRLLRELKPKYFFFENVKMKKEWMDIITKELGVNPMLVNSTTMIPQNRERYYWTNIPYANVPENNNTHISDVIPNAISGAGKRGIKKNPFDKYKQNLTIRKDNVANCITTGGSNTTYVKLKNGKIRPITIIELEQLQTFPKNYTYIKNISMSARRKAIGNSWTVNVVSHFLKAIKRSEKKLVNY